jgi:cobalt-zinc-cadmium efflux system membrane fusion protein
MKIGRLGLLATFVFAAVCGLACSVDRHDDEGVHEGEGHGGHEGHGEHGEEEGGDLAMSAAEILAAECEHGRPTHQCAECRYEVGVVKLDPSLLRGSGDGEQGIVGRMRATARALPHVIEAVGEVGLDENTVAHIAPRIPGTIAAVRADIGSKVREGTPLFEIDSVELGQATTAYMKSGTMTALARKNYEREKALVQRKISSEKELIDAQISYEQSRAELMAAEQGLQALGLSKDEIARLAGRSVPLCRLVVRAPFAGTITARHAAVGELAGPESDVFVLADLATVWVWAGIYEHDIAALVKATARGSVPVEIRAHAFPDRVFKGKLDYVAAALDETTRTVRVRASIPSQNGALKPGMFCKVRALLSPGEKAVALPHEAVLSDEGVSFVFKLLKDDYYYRRAVTTGRQFGDWVEIVEGVAPGEVIVARGAFVLKSDVLRSKMGAGCAD